MVRYLPQKDLAALFESVRKELEQRDDEVLARLVQSHGRKAFVARYPKLSRALNREYAAAWRGMTRKTIKRINNAQPLKTPHEKALAQLLLRLSLSGWGHIYLAFWRNGLLRVHARRRVKRFGKQITATIRSRFVRLKKLVAGHNNRKK